jgi:hypothetical protein
MNESSMLLIHDLLTQIQALSLVNEMTLKNDKVTNIISEFKKITGSLWISCLKCQKMCENHGTI